MSLNLTQRRKSCPATSQWYTGIMPMIQLPNAHLFYAAHLPKNANQTVVLIHGAGGSHLVWPAELRRLPHTAVYTLDLAGHGRSHPPGRRTIATYAEDILDFITALSLENVTLVGHSMGGAIVQQIGLAAPPRVSSLILLGTGAKLRVSPSILEAAEADVETAVNLINQYLWGSTPTPKMIAANRNIMLSCSAGVLLGDFVACNGFDLREQVAKIQLPTLVVSGTKDQMTPSKFGQFLADQLPNGAFALLDGVGHMLMLEAAEEVERLVRQFLGKLN